MPFHCLCSIRIALVSHPPHWRTAGEHRSSGLEVCCHSLGTAATSGRDTHGRHSARVYPGDDCTPARSRRAMQRQPFSLGTIGRTGGEAGPSHEKQVLPQHKAGPAGCSSSRIPWHHPLPPAHAACAWLAGEDDRWDSMPMASPW